MRALSHQGERGEVGWKILAWTPAETTEGSAAALQDRGSEGRMTATPEGGALLPHSAYLPAFPDFPISPRQTALLVIDMQYLDAHPDYGVGMEFRRQDLFHLVSAYYKRIADTVLPNIRELLEAARQHKVEVIFTVIEALTRDGRDISAQHRRVRLFAPKGSKEAQVLEGIEPVDDEIVLSKTASGVFNATAIDQVLRNMGIGTLLMTGVTTNGCVETAVRDAADRGYRVVLVEDACAAYSPAEHDAAIKALGNNYAWIRTTAEVLSRMERQ